LVARRAIRMWEPRWPVPSRGWCLVWKRRRGSR
jgi:hypothetical protein